MKRLSIFTMMTCFVASLLLTGIFAGCDTPGNSGCGSNGGNARPETATLRPGLFQGSISVNGVNRTYLYYVPDNYTENKAVPVLFEFHPLAGTATGRSSYTAIADREGFVIVFPQGIDNAWNIGPCCTHSRSVDDVGFTRALLKKMLAKGNLDSKRVYAVGHSMGGGMSHYLACNAADIIAAVAPSAMDLLEENVDQCSPARPITVMASRGTADFAVPYNGGAIRPPTHPYRMTQLGAVDTFEKWAELNGCTGRPVTGHEGKESDCRTYANCDGGVEVTLCTLQGQSHVPNSAQENWDTISRYSLP